MITIAARPDLKTRFFCDSFSEEISFVSPSEESNLYFENLNFDLHLSNKIKIKSNQVSFLVGLRQSNIFDRKIIKIREGFCVDNRISSGLNFNHFCFSQNDLCDIPYIIPAPNGPVFGSNKTIKNETYNNKVFWSGTITHETRNTVLSFYETVNDKRFDVTEFKERVYKDGFQSGTYEAYLENLSKSDVVYMLRGDRIWTHTFFDVIRCGCIPVMINSMNDYGWENIFTNVDDYMLRFDLREHSMDYIHQQVTLLLEDRERVLGMKDNIRNFHQMFFKHNCSKYGFSEFLLAKLVEIYKNNFDINKVDDKFICPEVLNLKNLNGKL